ncbi:Inactive histone-lysine N-methyltransferase 2E [Trichinella pseudospiralis]
MKHTVEDNADVNGRDNGKDVVGNGQSADAEGVISDDEAETATTSTSARSKSAAATSGEQQQGRRKQRNESKGKRGSIELARLRKDYWYSRQGGETSGGGESGAGGVDWTLPNERTKTSTREERKMQSIMRHISWMEEREKKLQRKRGSQQAADRRPEKKQPRRRSMGDVALLNRAKQVETAKRDDDGAASAFDGQSKVLNIVENLSHSNSEHAKDSVGELIEKVVEQQADLMSSNINNDKHILQQKSNLKTHREQSAAAALNNSKTTEEAHQKMINFETLNQIGNNGYSRGEFYAGVAALPKRKLSLDEYKHRKQINEGGDVSDNKEHTPPLPLQKPKSFFPDMSYDMLKSLALHFNNPVGVPTLPVEKSALPDLTTPAIPCGLETSDDLELSANEDQNGTFEMQTWNASNTNFDQNRKDEYQDIRNVQSVVIPMKSTGNEEEKNASPPSEEYKTMDKNNLAAIDPKISRQEQTCSVDINSLLVVNNRSNSNSIIINNNNNNDDDNSNDGYSCGIIGKEKVLATASTVVSVAQQCASAAVEERGGGGGGLNGNFELNQRMH